MSIEKKILNETDISKLSTYFENSLDPDYKKRHGVVYTPQWVTSNMVSISINKYIKNRLGKTWDWIKGTNSIDDYNKVLEELRHLQILDPSVGSGNYTDELVEYLLSIYEYIYTKLNTPFNKLEVLLYIIHHIIYAIDIDADALEITKFKLWMKCIEAGYKEPFDTFKCNLIQGDSLNTKFNGINIEHDYELSDVSPEVRSAYIEDWQENWLEYQKDEKSKQHWESFSNLINLSIDIYESETKKEYGEFRCNWKMAKNRLKVNALNWKLEFPEVTEGFGIIISNPPYVRNIDSSYLDSNTLPSSADLYMYFLELWKTRGNKDCILCMITPNRWFSAAYAKQFRETYIPNIETIYDFNMHWIFEGVFVTTEITVLNTHPTTNLNYANMENIIVDKMENNFREYYQSNKLIISKQDLLFDNKFIFGEKALYDVINKINQFPTMREAYNTVTFKGETVQKEHRHPAKPGEVYIAKGEDILSFSTLQSTSKSTSITFDKSFENIIGIPEITGRIRAGRIGPNVIPLDSITCIQCDNPNILPILNSTIFNCLYTILICTNFMVSYAEVRFPRKGKQVDLVPVPPNMDSLEFLRVRTNNYEQVSDQDIQEMNSIIQKLYNLTDQEVEILKKYNI